LKFTITEVVLGALITCLSGEKETTAGAIANEISDEDMIIRNKIIFFIKRGNKFLKVFKKYEENDFNVQ